MGQPKHTINLTTNKVIANNTQIDGGGLIVLNMNANDRHFYVAPPATLRLASIRLDAGEVDGDGGIIRNDGTVIANDVVFGGGYAAGSLGLGGFGGAIRNDGTLEVTDSTFTTNRSRACGGWPLQQWHRDDLGRYCLHRQSIRHLRWRRHL